MPKMGMNAGADLTARNGTVLRASLIPMKHMVSILPVTADTWPHPNRLETSKSCEKEMAAPQRRKTVAGSVIDGAVNTF
jgi:hypothetical protein